MLLEMEDLERLVLDRTSEDEANPSLRHLDEKACARGLDEATADLSESAQLALRQRDLVSGASSGWERRRHPRLPTDQPAVLKVIRPETHLPLNSRVVEVSRGGLKLHLGQAI